MPFDHLFPTPPTATCHREPMTEAIPGVDLAHLAAWMDEHGLGEGPIESPSLLAGGTQNVLVRFERAGRPYVLRRPPLHKRKNSDETMRREARVLAALAGTDVPHPGFIAGEPDTDTLGAAFYLMEPVDGFNPTVSIPEPYRSDPALVHQFGLSMADAIASLGRVDHLAVGLDGFGKPDGWLERQVERWRSHLAGYDDFDGYDGPDIPGVEDVAAWLTERTPTDWSAGIIHGDFHLANVLVHPTEGRLAAVVDWELATLGDPLLDLGHVLSLWPDDDRASGFAVRGLPSAAEVIDRYADQTTRSLDHIDWYRVLACYRLGIILEGTHARACAGKAPTDIGDLLHATTVGLFERAHTLIGA